MTIRKQTDAEEVANSMSHGLGALLALAAMIMLVALGGRQGNAWRMIGAGVFGGALTLLYVISALYHGVKLPKAKRVLRILDHSSVFILIAGTYTPITLVMLPGAWGWTLFGLVWGLAALGIALKLACFDKFHRISIVVYLSMGWIGVVAFKPMLEQLPRGALAWIAAGGMVYSLGVIFYKQERLYFAHAIWHLFVIAGSVMHFIAIYRYVIPA